jgi:stearoyl-CoA desaturase (delta-9 desaturase)
MTTIIATLVMVQITIACVTLYLHRSQAHRAVTFHPVVAHFMRFWLWMTTAMVTEEWVAVHRKHHQKSDQAGDPHSPQIYGIWTVLFKGVFLYKQAAKDRIMIAQLSTGTPDDWIERHLYKKYNTLGILIMLLIDLCLFGLWGWLVWGVQMLWIPINAAGLVNGLCHWWGYRNTNTPDTSRNLIPVDFWCGGEFLHNNHHSDGANPCFRQKWYEFDIGWVYICILQALGLAKLREKN